MDLGEWGLYEEDEWLRSFYLYIKGGGGGGEALWFGLLEEKGSQQSQRPHLKEFMDNLWSARI